MRIASWYFSVGLIFLIGLLVSFQNCKGVFQSIDNSVSSKAPIVSSKLNCIESNQSHACVIDKNSVYEKGQISSREGPDYNGLSLKPVELSFLDDSGFLQNDTFRVLSYTGQQVRTTDSLKFGYESDQGVALSQVTSYYYSSLARKFSQDAKLSLVGKGLYIITQAPVTGWSIEDNTIYLGLDPETQHDSGLDGSLILSLVSEANIYYANLGAINTQMREKHRDCRGEKELCCIDDKGCSKAITIGLSLYFSSYFFQDTPTVGESYSNSLTGMEDCGISRNLNESKYVSISEAFNACGDNKGLVYPMATVYASIWWNVFKKVLDTAPEEAERFQVFYLKHLKGLRGNFDFIDTFNSMKELDSQDFESKFTPYFMTEFTRRGITL